MQLILNVKMQRKIPVVDVITGYLALARHWTIILKT